MREKSISTAIIIAVVFIAILVLIPTYLFFQHKIEKKELGKVAKPMNETQLNTCGMAVANAISKHLGTMGKNEVIGISILSDTLVGTDDTTSADTLKVYYLVHARFTYSDEYYEDHTIAYILLYTKQGDEWIWVGRNTTLWCECKSSGGVCDISWNGKTFVCIKQPSCGYVFPCEIHSAYNTK